MNADKEFLKGAAAELRAVAYELDQMAKKGIDSKRLDEIARQSLAGAASSLKDMAYRASVQS